MKTIEGAAWAIGALLGVLLSSCSSIDERTPDVDDGDDDAMGAGPSEASMATLQPAPGAVGSSSAGGGSGSGGPGNGGFSNSGPAASPEGNAPIGNGVAGSAPMPAAGAGQQPIARGAECTLQQACEGSLVCGRSATPDVGTGRVCCDRACEEGACSELGLCTEHCVVGQSRVGQCLVEPG